MRKPPKDMEAGVVHSSNQYGDFRIHAYHKWDDVDIEFLSTGTISNAKASQIRKGSVKDNYLPFIFGVGFPGEGRYPISGSDGNPNTCYRTWRNMLARCYSPEADSYSLYGGKGVTVHKDWHNYQNYAEWCDNNNWFEGCHLDKDKKGNGMLYSADTCTFITPQENSELALAKHYEFLNPQNEIVKIYNLRQYCLQHGLHQAHMVAVHLGKLKHHRQWRKA